MQITVHRPDLEQFVAEKVKSGEYPSAEAVVEEALARLQVDQGNAGWTHDELCEAARVGLDQLDRGDGIDLKSEQEVDAFFQAIKQAGRSRSGQDASDQ